MEIIKSVGFGEDGTSKRSLQLRLKLEVGKRSLLLGSFLGLVVITSNGSLPTERCVLYLAIVLVALAMGSVLESWSKKSGDADTPEALDVAVKIG